MACESITITDVYDNVPFDARFKNEPWGFAVVIEGCEGTTLFDTGGSGRVLLENLAAAGMDPGGFARIFLSHAHNDHTGGLRAVLERNRRVTVFAPASFPGMIREEVTTLGGKYVVISESVEIAEGLTSTGEMEGMAWEQSLVIDVRGGPVLVTGCAHPGIVDIARRAAEVAGRAPRVVLGGFHLEETPDEEIEAVCADLEGMGVERIGASHCTGQAARAAMKGAWGEGWIEFGAGARVAVP